MKKADQEIDEDEQFLAQREAEILRAQDAMYASQSNPYASAMFGGPNKQNLVEWQLDFRTELEDIEHLLRCDVIDRDREGNEYWKENPNKDYIVFNSLGVNDIIRYIRMFLNKNKVLSNYGLEEIKPRVRVFAHELRMLIYNNYEAYGINTPYKENNFPMMVLTIRDMVDSAYRRAINGEERRDLNQARVVQQTEPMMGNMPIYGMPMPQKKGLISRAMPWNWGK